jgi:hypothetical protein
MKVKGMVFWVVTACSDVVKGHNPGHGIFMYEWFVSLVVSKNIDKVLFERHVN